jgi:hypothetical protein
MIVASVHECNLDIFIRSDVSGSPTIERDAVNLIKQ